DAAARGAVDEREPQVAARRHVLVGQRGELPVEALEAQRHPEARFVRAKERAGAVEVARRSRRADQVAWHTPILRSLPAYCGCSSLMRATAACCGSRTTSIVWPSGAPRGSTFTLRRFCSASASARLR